MKELENEFSTIRSLEHNNLMKLLDFHFKEHQQILVYEYMQKKSLADVLFDSESRLRLSWTTRLKICLGIARGLEYIHQHPRLRILHRNIRATNILLDENFEAKISDFGMPSLIDEDNFINHQYYSQGYMAPAYFLGFVTPKADVYSFGVVILDIVSGKKNVDGKSLGIELLVDTAYDLHRQGRLLDLVDKDLSLNVDAKEAVTILNLAIKCTSISAGARPTMSEVLSILHGEKSIDVVF